MNCAFVTTTDYSFYPGTLATVNSVLQFHPDTTIYVVENENSPLNEPQRDLLQKCDAVRLLSSSEFEKEDRHIGAWELKAYAAHDLCDSYDVICLIDSDCLLCSSIGAELRHCWDRGLFMGGKDGDGVVYDESYAIYGMEPSVNYKYMSTSLCMIAVNPANKTTLGKWAKCSSQAEYNRTGSYPGHGDQGLLNALLFAEDGSERIEVLENSLWSQHWAYWDSIVDYRDNEFVNLSANGKSQRSFHCGGAEKYWLKEHRERILDDHSLQIYPYAWFLAMLWFGHCKNWEVDPKEYLTPESHHLISDLPLLLTHVFSVFPSSRYMWNGITEPIINRVLSDIPHCQSLGHLGLTEIINLIDIYSSYGSRFRRYVEIGSNHGRSLLALALRFANRDIDFFAVESFMGNKDGDAYGNTLPSRLTYLENLARFPSLRAKLVAGDSKHAVKFFDDSSINFLFINGFQDTIAVLKDIDAWLPKICCGGIIAGGNLSQDKVRSAIALRFPDVNVTESEEIWWKEVY